jgi:sugar phosphate permease
MKKKKNNFKIYGILTILFFGPLVLFILAAWYFLPAKFASTAVGFVGLLFIVGGPLWAMQLEKKLRDRFEAKPKRDYSDVYKILDEDE